MEATNGVKVKRNQACIIPSGSVMTLSRGTLRLATRASATRFMPIDHFKRSLAEELRGSAIGVVLSGTATDGTRGLEAIRAEGGVTFAEDEESLRPASQVNPTSSILV